MITQLIYASRATSLCDTAALHALLESAVRNNAQRDITGLLLYCQGTFLQVLEGRDADLDALLTRLLDDRRHCDVRILSRTTQITREFSAWSMGLRVLQPGDSARLPHLAPFFEAGFDPHSLCIHPGLGLSIIQAMAAVLTAESGECLRIGAV